MYKSSGLGHPGTPVEARRDDYRRRASVIKGRMLAAYLVG